MCSNRKHLFLKDTVRMEKGKLKGEYRSPEQAGKMEGISEDGWGWWVEEERPYWRVSQRGQSGEVRTWTESANVLFRGKDYCRLVVSSHFALIDRKLQEGTGFCSLAIDLRNMIHTVQQRKSVKENVQHVLHIVFCWLTCALCPYIAVAGKLRV